jgi:transposase
LTSKIHHLVDGLGRPLVVLVSAGQAHDGPLFEHLLAHLKVDHGTGAAPRTRPDRVRADKAYSSQATRTHLRRRRIIAVIPEPSQHIAHRKRRGSRGGRPPGFDAEDYKRRNVIERNFNVVKQWRGLATRYDKLAIVYRAAAVLRAITIWLPHLSDTL